MGKMVHSLFCHLHGERRKKEKEDGRQFELGERNRAVSNGTRPTGRGERKDSTMSQTDGGERKIP